MNDILMIKLQHFFQMDMEIKKGIYNLAPSTLRYLDEESIQKYTDELDNLLMYIFSELKCVALDIFGNNSVVLSKIFSLETTIKSVFYSSGFDIDKLKMFYKKYVSDMHLDFINSVKRECVGYTRGGFSSIEKATSINELLHFFHSYVLNNNYLLKSVTLMQSKKNEFNYPINLRGIYVSLFERIFQQFPIDMNVGWTDLVAINEKKLIMMIRDRGHALSIEISILGNIARVEYFIPKLCNIDMINNLPGINPVNENSVGATGVFETDLINLPDALFHFIFKVPTDSDMVVESNKSY